MIRKILKVKTSGSRKTGDLKPSLDLPRGLNMVVHEYNEEEGWCIVEIWGSDHPILSPEERVTPEKINHVLAQAIEELATHPLSPRKLGEIYGNIGSFEVVDEKRKIVRREIDGKEFTYVRTEKRGRPREENVVIFDEG